MRLELGSGYYPTPGFVHLDANPNCPDVDIVADAYPLTTILDATVDELRAVDVLEHLPYRWTLDVLIDWCRVLRRGGRLYVQVPDAGEVMRRFVEEPYSLLERLPDDIEPTPEAGAAWRLFGGQDDDVCSRDGDDWRLNAHYAMFTGESLATVLQRAGFVVDSVETNEHPNLLCWASKR